MQSKSPIIVVEDTVNGPVSTTDDILLQMSMLCYSPNLKGIDLDQFMQMTDEKDFKQYGIKKTKHCRALSACADSIRRTSLSSTSSGEDDDEDDLACLGSTHVSKFRQYYDQLAAVNPMSAIQKWPNSHFNILTPSSSPPEYSTPPLSRPPLRRSSVPLASALPEYKDLIRNERRYSEGMVTVPSKATTKPELLPHYTCTVQKIGQASIKCEYTSPGTRPLRRQWRTIQMELSGTLLKLFEITPDNQLGAQRYPLLIAFSPEPKYRKRLFMSLSLSNASVSIATDYTKRENVFRLMIDQGPTLLVQVQTNAEVSSWMEKIIAGSNICEDLECRRMPKYFSAKIGPFTGCPEVSNETLALFEQYASEDRRRRESEPDALI